MTPTMNPTTTTARVDDADVARLLGYDDAYAAVEHSFRLLGSGEAHNFVRQRDTVGHATLNVMWAMIPALDVMGIKSYPVVRTDVTQGSALTLVLYRWSTGQLLAVMDAESLSQRRTAAASAVATTLLARPDSAVLSIVGCGLQAAGQVRAVAAVMPGLRTVLVSGRDEHRRTAFVESARRDLDVDVRAATPSEAAAEADVLVTATGASEPVLDGALVRPGTHVNAVGANSLQRRELDQALLRAAALVVVDSVEVAAAEGGDLVLNGIDPGATTELADVVTGAHQGRTDADDITVFTSHGLAVQDVACGALVHERLTSPG